MTNAVQDKVIKIIAEQAMLDTSAVSIDTLIEDIGLDSLGLVEAIFSIEEYFEIDIPFNANDPAASEFDVSKVKTIINAIEELVSAKVN